jgi:hypothetical protein
MLISKIFKPKTYSNGAYEVRGYMYGIWRWQRVWGIIVKTVYPSTYGLHSEVNFPKYHNFWDKQPQFKRVGK